MSGFFKNHSKNKNTLKSLQIVKFIKIKLFIIFMIHLEKYNAKVINNEIKNNLVHFEENKKEFLFSKYDFNNNNINNLYIDFLKNNKLKLSIYYYDLEVTQKDSRYIFLHLRQFNPSCEAKVILDFDKGHDKNNGIHLNLRYFPEQNKNNMINFDKLDELNHLQILFSEDKNFKYIDYFKTLINVINKLGQNNYLVNFQEYKICQLKQDSTEYNKLNSTLKKFIKN